MGQIIPAGACKSRLCRLAGNATQSGRIWPVSTIKCLNAGLMLSHRRRQWPNIKAALGQCLAFAGGWPQGILPPFTWFDFHRASSHPCIIWRHAPTSQKVEKTCADVISVDEIATSDLSLCRLSEDMCAYGDQNGQMSSARSSERQHILAFDVWRWIPEAEIKWSDIGSLSARRLGCQSDNNPMCCVHKIISPQRA